MKEVIGASVEVEYSSVGNMRKAIKEATGDLIAMQQKFGETSKEALEAAKKVATLRDRMKEANEVADLFDPGNRFKAVGNVIQGLAGGFTALTGAMGVLGVQSEDTEKALLKVQSALALSQGLSTITDMGKDFARLGSIIKTQVVTAFTTLRGALMATGIGLLTAAVAFLIENFDKVKQTIYDLFPATKGLFDNFDRIKQIAFGVGNAILQFITAPIKALIKVFQGDFSGALDAVKKGIEFTKNFRQGEQNEIKSQADEREKLRQEELKKIQEANARKLEEQRRAAAAAAKEREAERKRILAEVAAEERDKAKEIERVQKELTAEGERAKQERVKRLLEEEALEDERQAARDERINAATLRSIETIKQARQEDLANEQAIAEAKIELQNRVGNALGALADLVGRQTAAGKVLAVAEIALGTATGFIQGLDIAQKSAKATGPAAAFAFPIFYATQIAAVLSAAARAKQALAKAPGGGGSGVANISAPSVNSQAPLQAQLSPTVQATALNNNAINNLGNQAFRAYVLNADLQNENQINEILKRNSTI